MYSTAKEAVNRARAGEGPILIEAKSFRRRGHAQHDPAEYVPAAQREFWEKRDPIALYEKYLFDEKLLDSKAKKDIKTKITSLLDKEREFAENSPTPPPELASQGVYCTGDDCHKIRPKWQRPIDEVTPPRSSVEPVWNIEGFGSGKSFGGGIAPIHFGDTTELPEKPVVKSVVLEKEVATKRIPKLAAVKKSKGKSAARGKVKS
jgi:hypothetical protein